MIKEKDRPAGLQTGLGLSLRRTVVFILRALHRIRTGFALVFYA
jgi:hypothetical protein